MQGLVFTELKAFIEEKDKGLWNRVLENVGQKGRLYLSMAAYDDKDLVDIIVGAAKELSMPVDKAILAFGHFIAPRLIASHKRLVKPEWGPLDLLCNVEETMHRTVRANNASATPPNLEVNRRDRRTVVIQYRSQRKLCHLARGILQGVSDHYKVNLNVTEDCCMHRGDSQCTIVVQTPQ